MYPRWGSCLGCHDLKSHVHHKNPTVHPSGPYLEFHGDNINNIIFLCTGIPTKEGSLKQFISLFSLKIQLIISYSCKYSYTRWISLQKRIIKAFRSNILQWITVTHAISSLDLRSEEGFSARCIHRFVSSYNFLHNKHLRTVPMLSTALGSLYLGCCWKFFYFYCARFQHLRQQWAVDITLLTLFARESQCTPFFGTKVAS